MVRLGLEIVHRPDEREWLRGVRTRNRRGGNMWECFPPYLMTPMSSGVKRSNRSSEDC